VPRSNGGVRGEDPGQWLRGGGFGHGWQGRTDDRVSGK
jgi:hypothetical protein